MLSESILRRFVKDYSLPIVLFDEEHFNYYIDLYDDLFDTKKKFELLNQTVSILGGESEFFKEADRIQNSVIDHIKNKPEYQLFISCDMNRYTKVVDLPEKNLYIPENDGEVFMSIDLVKANFQALKFVDEKIVDCCKTYKEFIEQFTNLDYFKESKQIRQVIFGNLNPKRQQTVQKHIISNIAKYIVMKYGREDVIYSLSNDEIVLSLGKEIKSLNLNEFIKFLQQIMGNEFPLCKFNIFRLIKLNNYSYYIKSNINGNKEFKCVPSHFFPQVYKHFYDISLDEKDLDVNFEGFPAKLMKTLW